MGEKIDLGALWSRLARVPGGVWEAHEYRGTRPHTVAPDGGEWTVNAPHPDYPDKSGYWLSVATVGFGPQARQIAELIVELHNTSSVMLTELERLYTNYELLSASTMGEAFDRLVELTEAEDAPGPTPQPLG